MQTFKSCIKKQHFSNVAKENYFHIIKSTVSTNILIRLELTYIV
jgi:hypothetical protein